jgi:hypothetical protein
VRPAPHLANFRHSSLLDRFALDLDLFAWSTPPPLTPEHAVDLDRFAWSTPPPPALEHVVDLDRFIDSPDRALH